MEKKKLLTIAASGLIVLVAVIYWVVPREKHGEGLTIPGEEAAPSILYGIDYTDMVLEQGTFESGQTVSSLFAKYGIGPAMMDRTVKAAQDVFPLRNIRAGNKYSAFITADSLSQLLHFVYEQNLQDYIVISYVGDSVTVRKEHKDISLRRVKASATIESSLWNSMIAAGMSPGMTKNFEEIFAWTVDFFGLRQGDHFTVIYDEKFIEDKSVGADRIWGAVFHHNGKDIYAIPFNQGGKITYWDLNGNSLRKSMLKAPLVYSRISSRFSNARLHPVLRIVRPHHGVDYAAPSGTPVVAVADGTVSSSGWDGKGGGNTLKIKHSSGMMTGYLHLKGFAKGIKAGKRVNQGEVIGYVGSTGTSTGAHLDYRVWMNGKAIDPLKVTSQPTEPINKANRADFDLVKERILAELQGTLADSLKITQLDSLAVYRNQKARPVVKDSLR